MLDIKAILDDPASADRRVKRRHSDASFDELIALAQKRRDTLSRFEQLRHQQKELSSAFGKGSDPEAKETARLQLRELSAKVKELDHQTKDLATQLEGMLLECPNLVDDRVPDGRTEDDNRLARAWGEPLSSEGMATHQELGERLGILDFEGAARVSGSRFALYRGLGARLERSLWSFMLNLHTEEHGYHELLPPFLVTRQSMTGTGQLPKFEEDAFRAESDDLFLIPTAEVPVTNVHRGQIMDASDLPTSYAAFSACFRREAGSYGRDTQGLTRLHQFQKVELVKFVTPESSDEAHEALTGHAEKVLKLLGLPYRVMELCAGDIGFSAKRCYDLEVWLPGQDCWREISSCSNFGDFQARRANIRYRPEDGGKLRFVHTINGSGLAVGRTIMALLEHYQRPDGGVDLPECLWSYMGVKSIEP
jgi:seryl-tRNA synthetase